VQSSASSRILAHTLGWRIGRHIGSAGCFAVFADRGKIDLSWSFFVTNIGLNVVLAASSSRIDWQAHLGGFAAGVICCACLDIIEKALPLMLRCKFPEFAKMNSLSHL
jgi:membrane associated rhomboid family serine protease